MKGLKMGEKREEPGKGIRKAMDVFLTSEEDGKSGETQKAVIIEDEWIEGENEPKIFKVSRKATEKEERDWDLSAGNSEGIKLIIEGLYPEEWTVLVYPQG